MQEPYRQDDTYNYFRKNTETEVALSKPLGAELVQSDLGVVVDVLAEGGLAKTSGLLKKGDRIQAVNGVDVTQMPFDDVMAMLGAADGEIKFGIARTTIMRRPRDAEPVASTSASAYVAPEQEPTKFEKSFNKNFGSAEATKKILTKTAKITANPTTWKNPIYFWSVAGTALIFVPIILYTLK